MANTTGGRYYAVNSQDANDIGGYMQLAAEREDSFFVADLLSNRPSSPATPAKPGRRFYATDTGDLFQDTGSAWVHVSSSARAVAAAGSAIVTSSDSRLPFGSLTPSGPAIYSRAAMTLGSSWSNAKLQVAAAGLYRLSVEVTGNPADDWFFTVQAIRANSTHFNVETRVGRNVDDDDVLSACVAVALEATGGFMVQGATTGASLQISRATIERIGP